MKRPSAPEVLLISVSHSITLMGKVWLIVMVFLSLLILLFVGFPLYQDEQERFVCNTIQPGCSNVCSDLFSPVSFFRFWLVQLITLCLPFIIFVFYVVHKVSNTFSVVLNSAGHTKAFPLFKVHQEPFNKACVNKVPLVVEQLLEAGFGAAHYYLFGFYIPRRFLCQHPPCTTQVDCYISRPTEKTVMLNFMFIMAALSLSLNAVDFVCAIKRSGRQKARRKMVMETVFEEEQCFLSSSTGTDPNTALAQRDLKAQSGKTGSFRKRHGSSSGGGKLRSGEDAATQECCSPPCCSDGNNDYLMSQEEVLERNGSEVALCPQDPIGTPRSIRVNKRSRLKPPPPPRRDLGVPSGESAALVGDVSTATAVCTRRLGQYTLVELGGESGQEKRSEWV